MLTNQGKIANKMSEHIQQQVVVVYVVNNNKSEKSLSPSGNVAGTCTLLVHFY